MPSNHRTLSMPSMHAAASSYAGRGANRSAPTAQGRYMVRPRVITTKPSSVSPSCKSPKTRYKVPAASSYRNIGSRTVSAAIVSNERRCPPGSVLRPSLARRLAAWTVARAESAPSAGGVTWGSGRVPNKAGSGWGVGMSRPGRPHPSIGICLRPDAGPWTGWQDQGLSEFGAAGGEGAIMAAGVTHRSKSSAVTCPDASAASRSVISLSLAMPAIRAARS